MSYQYGATRTPSAAELDKMRRALAALQQAHEAATAKNEALERKLAIARAQAAANKPAKPRKRPKKLPPPVHGGELGLLRAAKESADLDRRTHIMIAAGQDSEWIREYKRIHNIKDAA